MKYKTFLGISTGSMNHFGALCVTLKKKDQNGMAFRKKIREIRINRRQLTPSKCGAYQHIRLKQELESKNISSVFRRPAKTSFDQRQASIERAGVEPRYPPRIELSFRRQICYKAFLD
jgi:chitinase